ncbi:serine/threonine-protein kinase [Nocardia transvalensis]|uniref:serine/threonine-protein kinase n=1 Tax=Nocardia transvalensis TaxID=37333 RepID=UPI0018930F57|nr:serine/threonine-protein kinase [Nocardia transvalensis]MBF6330440.1 serine/threonine protein kinase [Nocardia transvalensis]
MVTRLAPGDPSRIGRYRVLGQLGAGGMGRVLLGVGPDGRLVAIKQVHPHLVEETDFLPRFRREVQTSARVSGAFTAAVVDSDVDSESPWLASVFVPGLPLDRAVELSGPLAPGQIRTLAVGLAAALQAIHGVGLIHRDLKPANVILADDGPRVIDFGIARAVDERSDLTHTGSIIGSPAFMSPEQAQSEPLTPASDIFSLGAVLAMAALGKSPFAGGSMPLTLYNIVHTEPDLSGLPPEIRELVEPCLHKDPHARPTPEQILDFVGPLPPRPRPWSAAIHSAIAEQSRELAALVSDPEATQIAGVDETTTSRPLALDFEERLLRIAAASEADRADRRRKRFLAVVSAAVVILVGALVAGVSALSGEGDNAATVANPLAGLNLTKLRSLDACALMRQPLDPSLGPWARPPTLPEWGTCQGEAGGHQFELAVKRIDGYRDTGRTVDGVPIFEDMAAGNDSCTLALLPAKTDPQFGITLRAQGSSGKGVACGHANKAITQLAQRLSAGPPMLPDIRHSLARQDPCSLVDNITTKLKIGDKVPGRPDQLHSCKWVGGNTVVVLLSHGALPQKLPKPIPIDIDPARVVYVDEQELNSTSCTRQAPYRILDDGTAELVTVRVDNMLNQALPGIRCVSAQSILSYIMQNLPEVK